MLSGYLLPFEIVSVHLLVVLIGAAYLARAKRRVRPRGAADGRISRKIRPDLWIYSRNRLAFRTTW